MHQFRSLRPPTTSVAEVECADLETEGFEMAVGDHLQKPFAEGKCLGLNPMYDMVAEALDN